MSPPDPTVFVHPQGLCDSDTVGARTRVWAFAHVMAGAVVGEDCNIGGGAFVESGARLGNNVTVKNGVLIWDGVTIADDVFVGPGAVFTNDLRPRAALKLPPEEYVPTFVGTGASIGAGATIVCGVSIGGAALVAAGSVVTRDVAPHALVAGNPARRIGWVCMCGATLDAAFRCPECGRAFRLVDEVAGLAPADG